MSKKFKVSFMECDSWSGVDYYDKFYDTEEEAKNTVKENNDRYMGKTVTPDFYVNATYIGEI